MSGLDVSVAAVDLWGRFSTKNKASAYLWCQSFAGFYVPWAATGVEPSITYDSARLAALASHIFTKDVNDGSVQPGDNIFFVWGSDWHVVNVIGRDSSGRVLVVDTSSSGDVVRSLGRHVFIRHADTISLQVYGVSRTNGRGPRVTFDGWGGDAPAPSGGGAPASTGAQIDLRDGWAWYNSAGEAESERNPHGPRWTGEQLARGVYAVLQAPNAIQIRANDGSAIWISPKARDRVQGAPPAPSPAPAPASQVIDLDGWAWYRSDTDAANERNPHGPKWTGERLMSGTYPVTGRGAGGAVQVRANDGELVWVSPKAAGAIR